MKTRPPDLENINDTLPVEYQLEIIRRWADQSAYQVVSATPQRALRPGRRRAVVFEDSAALIGICIAASGAWSHGFLDWPAPSRISS